MLQDLPFDIHRLHAAYANGLTPAQVIDECYRRIAAAGDPGIFVHLADADTVKAQAAELGPFDPVACPLWGLPFVVKDNIDAAGQPTTAACPAFAYTPPQDAFVVATLRRAGALLIGKTNLDQFATGLVGVRSPYPPPRNALDPTMVPGGSSSGSAVAVARGMVSFALGTDTAGSGRVPAALNGIVGFKPSLGALSASGVVPACRTLDTISVFALTVSDAYAVFRVAAAFDAQDAYARRVTTPALAAPPATLRIGVPDAASRQFFGDTVQSDSFDAALARIAALGGEPVETDFAPFFEVAALLYGGAWVAERYTVVEPLLRDNPEAVLPVLRDVIGAAERMSAADAFRDLYRLQDLKRRVEPLLAAVDLLCVPSVPKFFTLADVAADPIGANSRLGTYTNFVNLLDLCGVTVPVAQRSDGLPGSVTLLATRDRDAQVAAFADRLQQVCDAPLGATGWPLPERPPAGRPAAGPEELALAVVGAHMSGLPLNGELTRLGARFLYAARTEPQYRLYSLPGGPPFRPGLVRDPAGAAIDLEVWALPSTRFGDFIRGVPAPLGIGTVLLENGEAVKGFLCEHVAVAEAKEVTALGGWRNYLQTLAPPTA